MKILVTGATGFLGSRLIEKLDGLNYIDAIIATGRKIRKTHFIESEKIKYILGELSDEKFVNNITSEVDIIINCVLIQAPGKIINVTTIGDKWSALLPSYSFLRHQLRYYYCL